MGRVLLESSCVISVAISMISLIENARPASIPGVVLYVSEFSLIINIDPRTPAIHDAPFIFFHGEWLSIMCAMILQLHSEGIKSALWENALGLW
ncbi:MAG: hypothetical protein CMF55_02470 [Legionellales bacterium]|nr:hypothetical protein [Legionellales bacterium]